MVVGLLFLVGCAPPWIVIQQSGPPSALRGASSVSVHFSYEGLTVNGMGPAKSEAEWVAAKTAEEANYPETWASLKAKWEDNVLVGLTGACPVPVERAVAGAAETPNGAVLTVTMNQFQMGKFIPFATTVSRVEATHAWARGGQTVDAIRTDVYVVPTLTTPSVFQHIQGIGRETGKRSAMFAASKLK